jgi:hypothetical protein
MTQGRHGELIVVQGGGVRPARWTGKGSAVDAGMDAPSTAPSVTASGDAKYYVARVDVTKPGACYYSPPEVAFTTAGTTGRPATAASYLSQASVGEIRVIDGGKFYPAPPTVELSDTHGKGAVITAELDVPDTGPLDPTNNPQTGLSQWDIIETPPLDSPARFAGLDGVNLDLAINGNGTFTVPTNTAFLRVDGGSAINGCNPARLTKWTRSITYTVAGWQSGSGAVLRIRWTGSQWISTIGGFENCAFFAGATQPRDATARKYGANYSDDATVTVTIRAIDGDLAGKIVLQGYTAGNANNTAAPRYSVKSLTLVNSGSGYLVAPQIKITSESGFGAYGTCKVKNGRITEVTLENSGGGYKTAPTVEVVSGGAEAFAVSRPHLRGKYQCYYRYVDDTPEDKGGPIPSNLSPLTEIDAGEGTGGVVWDIPAPTGRATKVELWRSTSNQATTLYRVAVLGVGGKTDPDYTPLRIIIAPTNRIFQNSATVLVAVAGGANVAPTFVWQQRAPGGDWADVVSPSLQIVPASDGSYSCLWFILNWTPAQSGWEVRCVITRGSETVTTQPVTVTYHSV